MAQDLRCPLLVDGCPCGVIKGAGQCKVETFYFCPHRKLVQVGYGTKDAKMKVRLIFRVDNFEKCATKKTWIQRGSRKGRWIMAGACNEQPVAVCWCGNVKMKDRALSFWSKSHAHVAAGKRLMLEGKIEKCCCCLGHPEQLGGFSGQPFYEMAA